MEGKIPDKEQLTPISASRIKTLENCSWMYWSNYHLKLPQKQNDGARKGDFCHQVFEHLLNKKHFKKFKTIIKKDSVTAVPSISRFILRVAKKNGLELTPEILKQLDQMILVGLKNDFFVKGGILVEPEYRFDILSESPKYHLKGFMDKPFIRGDEIIIDDFKSSKKKFEGEDEESNLQALFYSLAATKIWPQLTPTVRFIFLQFPDDPMMEVKFSKDTLKGFEFYLEQVQYQVSNFSEKDAKKNFAADIEPSGKEFKGRLLCGFAKFPGQKKKDGSPMWHCPYAFAFDYFIVKKPTGEFAYSALKQESIKLKPGEKIERAHYEGCPKFKNALDSFHTAPTKLELKGKTKLLNVLDDF